VQFHIGQAGCGKAELCPGFLNPAFPKEPYTRLIGFFNTFEALKFAHRHKPDSFPVPTGSITGPLNPFLYSANIIPY
jgi:hypothetical protein